MPKNDEVVSETSVFQCECGGDRFAVGLQGVVNVGNGVLQFDCDELACRCLECHKVTLLDPPTDGATSIIFNA